jgi:hypothetical protein
MFELPKAIETDTTPVKLLYQAAENARQEQQQMMQLAMKNEQTRREAFGGAQKQLFDIASAQNVPAEVQRQILTKGLNDLTSLYKNRKDVKSGDFGMMAMNTLIKAKGDSTAFQQYLGGGEKFIADLKEKGFDEVNLKTALSNSMFDEQVVDTNGVQQLVRVPKDPTKLGDPLQFLAKEVDANKKKYLDRVRSSKDLQTIVNDYKPGEYKFSSSQDLTGNKTVKVAYTEKSYPWTKTQEIDQSGQKVKINVLDTEMEDIGGQKVPILSKKAYEYFARNPNITVVSEIDAMGTDYIDDHNRKLGINPQQITSENFSKVAEQFPGAINPYDNGNRMIFSRLALTKMLDPQFGKFGDPSVTVDKAKPNVTNVYNNSDLYTKSGSLKPEAKFPTTWAQIVYQDREIMTIADDVSFQFGGKTLTGKKTGDRAQGQIIKDNGKRATVLSRPEEPGVIYVAEIEDNEISDNVIKLSGKEAINYGAKISGANGSDVKTFNKLIQESTKTVVPMSAADKANVSANLNLQNEREEGKALLGSASQIRALGAGETKNINNARVKLNGKEVVIKAIQRIDGTLWKSPVEVTLQDGSKMTFDSRDEFINTLIQSNK